MSTIRNTTYSISKTAIKRVCCWLCNLYYLVVIIMIVIGGLGSIEGAVLGAVVFTVGLEVFRGFGAFRLINFSVLLVLIMIYRPQGLLGSWTLIKRRKQAGAM